MHYWGKLFIPYFKLTLGDAKCITRSNRSEGEGRPQRLSSLLTRRQLFPYPLLFKPLSPLLSHFLSRVRRSLRHLVCLVSRLFRDGEVLLGENTPEVLCRSKYGFRSPEHKCFHSRHPLVQMTHAFFKLT